MVWTAAWAEAEASVPADVLTIAALELINSAIIDGGGNQSSIRAVNNTVDLMLPHEDSAPLNPGQTVLYTAIPFEVPWPDAQDGQVPKLIIKIDNAGKEIEPFLPAATRRQEPLLVILRVYTINTTTGAVALGLDPVQFQLQSVKISGSYVEGEAKLADLQNIQFCRIIYDIQHYPGLSRA